MRAGSAWSDEAQAWIGGEETPASHVVATAGDRALARFETEGVSGDVLQNWVHLPDGTAVPGNQIVRGEMAKRVVLDLKNGVEKRGLNVSQFETGGNMVFMVTADEASRAAIFQAAMQELERFSQQPGQCTPETLANLAYLLFQAPQNKKGSDAVIRTFLVTAGTYLTNVTPVLPQDLDLRAGTMTQRQFIQYATRQI